MQLDDAIPLEKPRALTIAKAARYTDLSERYVRLLIERSRLPYVRVGRRAIRLLVEDIDAFLMANRVKGRPQRREVA